MKHEGTKFISRCIVCQQVEAKRQGPVGGTFETFGDTSMEMIACDCGLCD